MAVGSEVHLLFNFRYFQFVLSLTKFKMEKVNPENECRFHNQSRVFYVDSVPFLKFCNGFVAVSMF